MADRPHLRRLAGQVGILSSYRDADGQRRDTSDRTREAILQALGIVDTSEAGARAALAALRRADRDRGGPPVRVVAAGAGGDATIEWRLPGRARGRVTWNITLTAESGDVVQRHGTLRQASRQVSLKVRLPKPLPLGYHDLRLEWSDGQASRSIEQMLIAEPPTCFTVREALGRRRAFGVWANAYSMHSKRTRGAADLTDIGQLASWAVRHGARFLGLNPLHAVSHRPGQSSPYAPISRLFRNLQYLNLEAVPEYAQLSADQDLAVLTDLARLHVMSAESRIPYPRIASLRMRILRRLHAVFVRRGSPARKRALRQYVAQQGKWLSDFATFCTLADHLDPRAKRAVDWRRWPAAFRDPDSADVARFRQEHAEAISLHAYAQFELDRQLAAVAERSGREGMMLGLYHDLAIGSAAGGSDTWADPALFVRGIHVGAPPDSHSAVGQNWSFPPLSPMALSRSRFAYWRQLLRNNLAHGGMLRIDHVMGLFRQFWIPEGCSPAEGAYVRFPADELLAVLAVESRRQRTVIVGEDLGTVPAGLPAELRRRGILSTRVLYFGRTARGYRPPSAWSDNALAMAHTHDHVPLPGFISARDVTIRKSLGQFADDAAFRKALEDRRTECQALARRLRAEDLLTAGEETDPVALRRAVYLFLARTRAPLVAVSLDDLGGEASPVNLPGVEYPVYPCWARRMGRSLEQITADQSVVRLLAELARLR